MSGMYLVVIVVVELFDELFVMCVGLVGRCIVL